MKTSEWMITHNLSYTHINHFQIGMQRDLSKARFFTHKKYLVRLARGQDNLRS